MSMFSTGRAASRNRDFCRIGERKIAASVRLDVAARETMGSRPQKDACQALVAAVSPLLVILWPVKYERRRLCPRISDARILNANTHARALRGWTRSASFKRENQAMHAHNCSYGKKRSDATV